MVRLPPATSQRGHAVYLATLAVVGLIVALTFHVLTGSDSASAGEGSRTGSTLGLSPVGAGASAASASPPAASSAASSAHPSPTTTASHPATASPTSATQIRAQASARIAALAAAEPAGSISVAAVNTVTGASYSAGATSGMWTASTYKLFVLETLLLQAQQSGTPLSDAVADQATTMIENSDNEAGYDLFLAAGGNAGLSAAAATFGMTHTVPGATDPTFTTTSAPDYLKLLKNLVSAGPLDAASRSYALGLMRNVEADQRWGVGVVADPGTDFANKNGWLSVDDTNGPGEDDNGLWIVSSVGVVSIHGQPVLMAVFSEHQPSMAAGVTLVQQLAQAVAPTV
jgi:beta-lactamase class A